MHRPFRRIIACVTIAALLQTGCAARRDGFLFNPTDDPHYKQVATEIDFPNAAAPGTNVHETAPPRTLDQTAQPTYWDIKLEEAVQLALENSRVLRDLGGLLLRSPQNVRAIYDPATVETDPRFGVEAALSEFDTIFSYRANAEKNDRALNNQLLGGGTNLFTQDLTILQAQLQKRAATGTIFSFRNNTEYDANSAPANLFGSAWNTNIEAEFRHPLLQNGGVEFNRIAGPNAIIGQPNGVLIARVNTDVSLTDFERGLRDLVSNVENAYWDLYFSYRDLDAKIAARDAALSSWQKVHTFYTSGRRGGEAEKEAEAREQYFRFQEEVQNSLAGRLIDGTQTNNGSSGGTFRATGGVQVSERRLRLLLGLPISDGRFLRPADEPPRAKIHFDWNEVLTESLVRRVELRRQKWLVKRRELELVAARNYLLPTLDATGRYRWRGFGKDLLDPNRSSGFVPGPGGIDLAEFDNAWGNLTTGDFQEWQLGLELNVPLGFRRGHSAVRFAELQLARERAVLQESERDVALGVSNAFADVDRAWDVVQTAYNRRLAARQQYQATDAAYRADKASLDLLLEAQRRQADAESRYYGSLVEYAMAIKNLHFEKGSLLDYNEIQLAEGPWPGKAYRDAAEREFRNRPPWPLNYLMKEPAPVSGGLMPQQSAPLVAPAEVVPPGAVPPPGQNQESIPPGTMGQPGQPWMLPSADRDAANRQRRAGGSSVVDLPDFTPQVSAQPGPTGRMVFPHGDTTSPAANQPASLAAGPARPHQGILQASGVMSPSGSVAQAQATSPVGPAPPPRQRPAGNAVLWPPAPTASGGVQPVNFQQPISGPQAP